MTWTLRHLNVIKIVNSNEQREMLLQRGYEDITEQTASKEKSQGSNADKKDTPQKKTKANQTKGSSTKELDQ